MTKKPDPQQTPSFGDAMAELEQILHRIEAEETDIDRLAEELRRAGELLDLARAKIRRAEVEVTQIVQSLEEGERSGGADSAGGGGADADEDEDDIPF